jgi:hypothetical protein
VDMQPILFANQYAAVSFGLHGTLSLIENTRLFMRQVMTTLFAISTVIVMHAGRSVYEHERKNKTKI